MPSIRLAPTKIPHKMFGLKRSEAHRRWWTSLEPLEAAGVDPNRRIPSSGRLPPIHWFLLT